MLKKKPKILIVDDIESNRIICAEILEDRYRLAFAEDGIEAIKLVDSFEPDLILLDVMMPIMSGLDVCREIRASARPWIKILMVSAKARTEDRLAGYEAGADDYICKPFDEDELLAKVHVHLKLKHSEELDALKLNVLKVLQHGHRSPITKVILHADTLQQYTDKIPAAASDCVRAIEKAAWQLHDWMAMAEQLFELKSGNVSASPRPLHLQELVEISMQKLSLAENSFNGSLSLIGECQTILGDGDLLEKMTYSLIKDSLERANSNSGIRIMIDDCKDGSGVSIEIQYKSDVTTDQTIRQAFEAFGVEDDVLLNRGDGMSLAIAREIAVLHGGHVVADVKNGCVSLTTILPTSLANPAISLASAADDNSWS